MIASISKITDNLYMSGCYNLQETTLKNLGIIFVVNCTQEVPLLRSTTIDTVRLGLEDSPYSNIGMYFDRMTDRIQEATKKGKVLVHCVAGVSRSASLVLAYLMKHHNMSLKDAHALVRSKRSIIRPNSGFWQQLVDFERQLRGSTSVKMVQTHYGAQPDLYQSEISSSVQPLSSSVSTVPSVSVSKSSYSAQRTPLSTRSNSHTSLERSSSLRSSSSYTDMLLQLSRDQRSASQTLLYRYPPSESSGRWGTRIPSTLPPLGSRNSSYLPTFYRFL